MPIVEGMCPWRDQVFTPLFNFATTTNISMNLKTLRSTMSAGGMESGGSRWKKTLDRTMKTRLATACALAALSSGLYAAAFQNLDFDSAVTNNVTGGYGPTSDLLPGWLLYDGPNQVPSIGYDLTATFLPQASIYDANWQGVPAPVAGNYSLGLYPGLNLIFEYQPFSLVQSGDIGTGINSIRFVDYGGPFELRLNNTLVPLTYNYLPGSTDPDTRVANVVGDVSAFAGQTVEIRFTTVDIPNRTLNALSGIEFSTQIAPEPGETALLLLGLCVLGFRFRHRRIDSKK